MESRKYGLRCGFADCNREKKKYDRSEELGENRCGPQTEGEDHNARGLHYASIRPFRGRHEINGGTEQTHKYCNGPRHGSERF